MRGFVRVWRTEGRADETRVARAPAGRNAERRGRMRARTKSASEQPGAGGRDRTRSIVYKEDSV